MFCRISRLQGPLLIGLSDDKLVLIIPAAWNQAHDNGLIRLLPFNSPPFLIIARAHKNWRKHLPEFMIGTNSSKIIKPGENIIPLSMHGLLTVCQKIQLTPAR